MEASVVESLKIIVPPAVCGGRSLHPAGVEPTTSGFGGQQRTEEYSRSCHFIAIARRSSGRTMNLI